MRVVGGLQQRRTSRGGHVAALALAAEPVPLPLITVVLCTRGLRPTLPACLTSLEQVDDPAFEVVVVENSPVVRLRTDVTGRGMRHVHEPRRGLDVARNRGLIEAAGEIVAFVDDDCEADPGWLRGVRAAFDSAPGVTLVTGRVMPARLSLPTHELFEQWFTFDRGCARRHFAPGDEIDWFPAFTCALGTGCNMAARRDALLAVGGFDEALDMGPLVGGGGDLDAFARLVDAGGSAVYAPDAFRRHHHRDTMTALRWQFWGYGLSQGAVIGKWMVTRPGRRTGALRFLAYRLGQLREATAERLRGRNGLRRSLLALEIAGIVVGPAAYPLSIAQSRWRRWRHRQPPRQKDVAPVRLVVGP